MEEINKFWNTVVTDWILGDLKRMVGFTPEPNKNSGNLNFSITLVLLASIELMGSLYSGKAKGKDCEAKNFMKRYFSEKYQNDKLLDDIWQHVRNGLAHAMIPKMGIGISRLSPNQHLERRVFKDSEVLILDADTFVADFENALSRYKADLDTDQKAESDDSLRGLFLSALNSMKETQERTVDQVSVSGASLPSSSQYTTYDPKLSS